MKEIPGPPRHRRGILEVLAPRLAARREEARLRLQRAQFEQNLLREVSRGLGRGGYQGATKYPPYSGWAPGGGSPDADILEDLGDLRERSRDLVRNDAHAAGLVDTWTQNIVGSGLSPQSRVDAETIGLSPEAAEEFQWAAEAAWRRFARKVDVTGRLTAGELQEIVLRQVFENGDVFVIPRPVKGRPYSLAVQVIEADRVATPTNRMSDSSVREGVAVGPNGEHTGYWIKRTHPGDPRGYSQDFAFVPAEAEGREVVFHLYRTLRPDQSRGVPFLAPALLLFRDLAQYFRAELVAAKVAACYALFRVQKDPFTAATAAASTTVRTSTGGQTEFLQPGMIERLPPGETIETFSPNRPNSAFDAFTTRILRGIGSSVQHPYELIAQDFSKTTYTSGRMALTEVRRVYRKYQRWLVEKLLQPLWERLLEEAFLLGELPAPGFDEYREAYLNAQWVGPGWQWVDPQKEVDATIAALEANLTTLADECAGRGLDWEEVIAQRAREKERIAVSGLEPEPPAPPEGPPAEDAEDDQEDEDDQEESDADGNEDETDDQVPE